MGIFLNYFNGFGEKGQPSVARTSCKRNFLELGGIEGLGFGVGVCVGQGAV